MKIFSFIVVFIVSMSVYAFEIGQPFVQTGHDYSTIIDAVEISKDGKYALSGGQDKKIILWDMQNAREIQSFIGHIDNIFSVDFSPDGKFFVSGSGDNSLRLWDITKGKEIRIFLSKTENTGWCVSAKFSKDGNRILASYLNGSFRIWDVKSGAEIKVFKGHKHRVNTAVYSSDEKYILSTSYDGAMSLWDSESGEVIRTFSGNVFKDSEVINTPPFGVFSPDDKYALSSSETNKLLLWHINSGQLVQSFSPIHRDDVLKSALFSKDGKYAIAIYNANSRDGKGMIYIWDVKTGKNLYTYQEQNNGNSYHSVCLDPSGSKLLIGCDYGKSIVWDINKKKKSLEFHGIQSTLVSNSYSHDGHLLLTLEEKEKKKVAKLWDIQRGEVIDSWQLFDNVDKVALSPTGKYILLGMEGKSLSVIERSNNEVALALTIQGKKFDQVSFTPDDENFLITRGDEFHVWDIELRKEIKEFGGSFFNVLPKFITSIAFSSDGKYMVSGSSDNTAKLWEVGKWKEVQSFEGHEGAEFTLKVDVVIAGIITGKGKIHSVAISKDNKYVLTGGGDGTARVWNVENGKEIQQFRDMSNKTVFSNVYAVAFSTDAKYALTSTHSDEVKIRDIKTGELIQTLKSNSGTVYGIEVDTEGKKVYVKTLDNILVYSIANGNLLAKTVSLSNSDWIVMTPNGYFNASKNGAKNVNILLSDNHVVALDNLYEKFYRPDIVASALDGEQPVPRDEIASIKPAPLVEIIKTLPAVSGDKATVTLKITDQGGGIGQIRLSRNDSTIVTENTRSIDMKEKQRVKTYQITLENGDNVIKATAFNASNDLVSDDALYTIIGKSKIQKPSLHAIIIGINDFANPGIKLTNAVSDAKLFAEALRKSSKGLFEQVDIRTLVLPSQTTKNAIMDEVMKLKNVAPSDLFIFYVASHGISEDGKYFLITSNVTSLSTQDIRLLA
jgi:WD40 repeat protein